MNSIIDSDRYAGTRGPSSRTAGGSGGGFKVDDILRRLCTLETLMDDVRTQVVDIRVQLSTVLGVLPTLATKADLTAEIGAVRKDLSADLTGVRTEVGDVRTDLAASIGSVRADIHALETRLIKWIVGAALASAGLAATIASLIVKFVH
jgi:hypothetical protein